MKENVSGCFFLNTEGVKVPVFPLTLLVIVTTVLRPVIRYDRRV